VRTLYPTSIAVLAIAALLSACGGGSSGSGGSGGTADTPTTNVPAAPVQDTDLDSFAAAWTSYILVQAVQPLQMTAGATGQCHSGGSVSYDAATGKQTLQQCRLKQFPSRVLDGSFMVSDLNANDDRSHVLATIRSPSVNVADAATGAAEFTLNASDDINSVVSDSDAGNSYFYNTHSMSFKAGQSSQYTISKAGSTSTNILFEGGVPVRYTDNLVFHTSDGKHTWQVTANPQVREAGENHPDRGGLVITKLGVHALTVTFGPDNTLTISGGDHGGTRTLNWNDASLQAALAARHR
jgi:hypothetical protein